MRAAARLGIQALWAHPWLLLVLALNTALPLLCALLIDGYRADMLNRFDRADHAFLVIQDSGSMGEFYGSRLPAAFADVLRARGYSDPIPEIHTVTGVTPASAVLLRGIDPARYQRSETFRMVAGRPLTPNDPPRAAMIGVQLSRDREAPPGAQVQIRGRAFDVIGVFETGSYADFEAWVSVRDAQDLLGWGDDVSVFVVPAGGALKAGDALPGGLSAVEKGASGRNLVHEWSAVLQLLSAITASLALWAALALAAALGRVAWLRRRDLGVMRVVGFRPPALAVHVCVQGLIVALLAALIAMAGALTIGALAPLQTAGIHTGAVFEARTFGLLLAYALGIGLAGSAGPALWLARLPLAGLMRNE